jgi:hypothetical protein
MPSYVPIYASFVKSATLLLSDNGGNSIAQFMSLSCTAVCGFVADWCSIQEQVLLDLVSKYKVKSQSYEPEPAHKSRLWLQQTVKSFIHASSNRAVKFSWLKR